MNSALKPVRENKKPVIKKPVIKKTVKKSKAVKGKVKGEKKVQEKQSKKSKETAQDQMKTAASGGKRHDHANIEPHRITDILHMKPPPRM